MGGSDTIWRALIILGGIRSVDLEDVTILLGCLGDRIDEIAELLMSEDEEERREGIKMVARLKARINTVYDDLLLKD